MFKRNAAVALIAALVLGVGAYAWAEGRPDAPSQGSAQTDKAGGPSRAAGLRHHRGAVRRAVHGDLVVRTKDGFENVTFDRGEVTAVGAGSITVKRPDGKTVTKKLTADTRFRGVGSAKEVKTGQPALVVSKGDTARLVAQRTADKAARAGQRRQKMQERMRQRRGNVSPSSGVST